MPSPSTAVRLGHADQGRPVPAVDFATAEFEGPWSYERSGGRLIVMAPAGDEHTAASEPWRDHLGAYRLTHPDCVDRVVSDAWIRIDADTDRIADIGVYLAGALAPLPIPERVPDLVFEVVGPGRVSHQRDYEAKRDEYHRIGVREYVIIDRRARRVVVLSHQPVGYDERVLGAADTYRSPLLPGLVIPLAAVF